MHQIDRRFSVQGFQKVKLCTIKPLTSVKSKLFSRRLQLLMRSLFFLLMALLPIISRSFSRKHSQISLKVCLIGGINCSRAIAVKKITIQDQFHVSSPPYILCRKIEDFSETDLPCTKWIRWSYTLTLRLCKLKNLKSNWNQTNGVLSFN